MSELKAIHAYTFDEVEVISTHSNGNDYYIKSEVDKVIARSKEKLVEQTTLRVWAELQLRHNKYKRCRAMMMWCASRAVTLSHYGNEKDSDWFWKWKDKWKKLAEKFKEEK